MAGPIGTYSEPSSSQPVNTLVGDADNDGRDDLVIQTAGMGTGPRYVICGLDNIASADTVNLQISVSKESSDSLSYDFSLHTSVGAGVGDWTASITAGFQTGYSTTSSSSEGTVFGGTIGYLPEVYYKNPNYSYESGVFACPYTTSSNKTFWVVNYWVE
jgi:hypothetical protein